MAPIIRTPAVSPEKRQLTRSASSKKVVAPEKVAETRSANGSTTAMSNIAQVEPKQASVLPQPSNPPTGADLKAMLQNQQELANARSAAEQRGYEHGIEKGEAAAKQALADRMERLTSITTALYRAKVEVLEGAEDFLIEIIYTAICRILGEVAVTQDAVIGMVNQVLLACRDRDKIVVNLHPLDAEMILQANENPGATTNNPHTVFRADASITLGGCTLESAAGTLDARLDVQLERLRDSLLTVRKSRERNEEAI
jgi:flagellar assembly protein FliH